MSKKRKIEEELEEQSGENIIDTIWNFFSSMKLGIFLLLIIAVASIVGTILVQENTQYWQQYSAAGNVNSLFKALGFYHIYQTWYFQTLLFLLCMNLLICSISRIKVIVAAIKQPKFVTEKFIKQVKNHITGKYAGGNLETAKFLTNVLNKKGYRVFQKEEEGKVYLASDKGRFGILGAYITHMSFVIIVVGAILSVFGFDTGGALPINQGETFNTSSLTAQGFKNVPEFQIKVNAFWVEKNIKGENKDYYSDLSVIDNGKEVDRKLIQVNDPLKYKGVAFYQSSYQRTANATLSFTSSNGTTTPITAKEFDANVDYGNPPIVNIPGTNVSFLLYSIVPNFDPKEPLTNANKNSLVANRPGVAIYAYEGSKVIGLKGIEKGKSIDIAGGKLSFVDSTEQNTTLLQMRKDPGEWTVWTGCALLVLGVYISFFMQPRKIWAIISEAKDGAILEIGGSTQKNKLVFEKEFKDIVEAFQESKGKKVKEG